MDTATETDYEYFMAMIHSDGLGETIIVRFPHFETNGFGLSAVLRINSGMQDVSPISADEFLWEQGNDSLCKSAWASVEDGRCVFDI